MDWRIRRRLPAPPQQSLPPATPAAAVRDDAAPTTTTTSRRSSELIYHHRKGTRKSSIIVTVLSIAPLMCRKAYHSACVAPSPCCCSRKQTSRLLSPAQDPRGSLPSCGVPASWASEAQRPRRRRPHPQAGLHLCVQVPRHRVHLLLRETQVCLEAKILKVPCSGTTGGRLASARAVARRQEVCRVSHSF